MIKLKCECGKEFKRPYKYKEYQERLPHSVAFKWKLMYCDECYKNRVNKALKRLPEIINNLIGKEIKQ